MVTWDDAQLVALAADGDTGAFGELFERYHKRIYNYAYGIAGNPDDAGDVAQDAFVKVYEALPRLRGRELNFAAYLYRTAHNLACDVASTRKRFAPPDELDLRPEHKLDADPERSALLKEQQAKAREAAFTLPENQRAILQLREIEDLSYQQIAEILEMPRNTVGVLLSRARLRFKGAFRMSHVDIDKVTGECRTLLPMLSGHIDGELTGDERARVGAHLEECPLCRLALEEMTEASKSYRGLIPLMPPLAMRTDLFSRLAKLDPSFGGGDAGGADTQVLEPVEAGRGGGPTGSPTSLAQSQATQRLAQWLGGLSGAQKGVLAMSAVAVVAAVVLTAGALAVVFTGGIAPLPQLPAGLLAPAAVPTVSPAPAPEASPEAPPLTDEPATRPEAPRGETGSEDEPASSAETQRDTAPPPAPSPVSPAGGKNTGSRKVVLRWTAVEDPSGVTYSVEVQEQLGQSEGYGSSRVLSGITGTSQGLGVDASGARWRVWATDGAGNTGPKSGWATFTTEAVQEPDEAPSQTQTTTPTYPPIY